MGLAIGTKTKDMSRLEAGRTSMEIHNKSLMIDIMKSELERGSKSELR